MQGAESSRPLGIDRAVASTLCIGTLAALLFAALNDLVPREAPSSFALVFLGWSLLFYAALFTPFFAGLWLAARLSATRWLPQAGLVIIALAALIACAAVNREAVVHLFGLEGPVRFRWLAPASFLSVLAGLLAGLTPARPGLSRALAILPPLLAVVAFLPAPARRVTIPPAAEATRTSDPARRLVLIGLDGADWSYIKPLIARGELPQLAALRDRGAWGHLKTFIPTKSPVLWTSIATGQPPQVHGVRDFTCTRVRGVQSALPPPRLPRGLGFDVLFGLLKQTGQVFESPIVSTARQVPAFWDIATAHGSPVAVYNWWATWPADPVLGSLVSERVYYWRSSFLEESHLTYPEPLYQEIATLVMRPEEVRYEHTRAFMDVTPQEFEVMRTGSFPGKTIQGEFKYFYSMFETDRRIGLHLIERSRTQQGAPADLLMLFRIVDLASHCSLAESELVKDHIAANDDDRRKYGRVVSEAYRAADRAIGEILTAFGEANVVVISDHGFAVERHERGQRRLYHHLKAPDGVFLAAGPAFRPGKVEGLNLYDILPLLAYLKGFAVAEDLRGRIPFEVFDPAFTKEQPVVRVASYGRRQSPTAAVGSAHTDEAVLERLRAVGYVQ